MSWHCCRHKGAVAYRGCYQERSGSGCRDCRGDVPTVPDTVGHHDVIAGPAGICLSVFGGISCAVGLQKRPARSRAACRGVPPLAGLFASQLKKLILCCLLNWSRALFWQLLLLAPMLQVFRAPSETHVFRQAVKGQVGSGLCGQDAVAIVGVPYRKVAFLTGRKSIVGITGVGAAHRLCRAASALPYKYSNKLSRYCSCYRCNQASRFPIEGDSCCSGWWWSLGRSHPARLL